METFSALLTICAENSPVPGEFPTQRPVTRSFDVFFDLRLNKRLSKQSWGWWFETLSHPLWRHRNGISENKDWIIVKSHVSKIQKGIQLLPFPLTHTKYHILIEWRLFGPVDYLIDRLWLSTFKAQNVTKSGVSFWITSHYPQSWPKWSVARETLKKFIQFCGHNCVCWRPADGWRHRQVIGHRQTQWWYRYGIALLRLRGDKVYPYFLRENGAD